MKARLVNNYFAGIYTDAWLALNQDRIVNGSLVSSWTLIDDINTGSFLRPLWNGSAYEEGASQSEIDEITGQREAEEDSQENFLERRDAVDIINKYNERLKRKVKNGQLTVNQSKAIRNGIKSILQCMEYGWWDIAKDEAAALPDVANPTIQAEIDFIKNQIANY